MTTAAPPPDAIGPYRVLRPIARGGMAEVYEVEDAISGERFALKLLVLQGSALPRFNREYEALTRLNHSNIVRVYQYGIHEGSPWVTMELLAGTPLQGWVKAFGKPGDPARTKEVMRVIAYVAEALNYIHARGLVHRDLKSDNVIVLPDGRVKLLDFGAARILDALDPITREGEFVGTFAYAAPEQLTGAEVDARADLYSLGVLLYRMCTGQRPFDTNDPLELARLHAKAPVPRPRDKVPDLPEALDNLVAWMLQKRPDQRPEKAKYVARALREIAGDLTEPRMQILANPDQAVGREADLRAVVDRLENTEAGGAVLIEGGEGSGRIRFARAVATTAEDRGALVMSVALTADRAMADLLGLLDQISGPLRHDPRPEAKAAADALLRQVAEGGFETMRGRDGLRRAAGMVLVERARKEERPMVLVFHNLHLAPPSALDVIVGMRREAYTAKAAVRFLGSCREESEEPDIIVRQRLPDAHRVRLQALPVRAVALTVGTMLHRRPPPADLARAIHVASGGQPAYVEEVVRDLVTRGAIESRGLDGNRLEWTIRDNGTLPIAPSAREAVDRGLRKLPRAHRRVLEVLAVAGDELPVAVLASACGLTLDELRVALDVLMRDGWLAVEPDGSRVRWDRPIARLVLLDDLHVCWRDAIRRALILAMRAEPPSPVKVRLLLEADQPEQAASVAIAASDALLDQGRLALAAEQLDEVVRRLTLKGGKSISPDQSPAASASLYLQHARILLLVRPTDPLAARSINRGVDLARDDRTRALATYQKARLQSVIGHYPNYRKYLHEASDLADKVDDPRLSSTIAAHLAVAYQWFGQPKSAAEWLDKARSAGLKSGSPAAEAYADGAMAGFRLAQGELIDAERLAAGAMDRFKAIGHARGVWGVLGTWSHALREQGRFSEAIAAVTRALPEVRDAESPSQYVALLLAAARSEIDLYRLGKAQEVVDELEATIRTGEHLHLRLETRLLRGRILIASGQYVDAVAALTEVLTRGRSAELFVLAELARALLGEAQWALGQRDEAMSSFQNARLGLLGTGDLLSLAEAIAIQARASAEILDPQPMFEPVRDLLDNQTALRVRMESLIARARWLTISADPIAAFHAWRDAATLLNRIAGALDDIERAALRVHPWSRAVRKGLKP